LFIYKFRETRRLSLDKEEQARQNSAIRVGEHVQQPAKRDFATNNNECNCENRTGALCTFYSFGAPDALDAVVVKLKTRDASTTGLIFLFWDKVHKSRRIRVDANGRDKMRFNGAPRCTCTAAFPGTRNQIWRVQ
jgi:hypothetical protein